MASYSDDFNRGDSDSLGADWVEWDQAGNANDPFRIDTNKVEVDGDGDYVRYYARYDTALTDENHSVEATFDWTDPGGGSQYLVWGIYINGNTSEDADETMLVFMVRHSDEDMRLYLVDGGSTNLLDTNVSLPATGSVMKIERDGADVKCYDDDVEVLAHTLTGPQQSALSGNKYGGMHYSAGSNAYVETFDDFTIEDVAVGEYFQSAGGILTPVGTIVKRASKILVGSSIASGIIVKQTSKSLTGSSTLTGILATAWTRLQSNLGSLTASGSIVKQTQKIFTGATTASGILVKQTAKSFTGSLTPSGVVSTLKARLLSISGSLTPSGTLIRQTRKIFSGSLTATGSLIKQTAKSFIGNLTAVGSLATQKITGGYFQVVGGVLTMAGSLTRQTGKQTAGIVTMAGSITRRISKSITGTLTAVGTLIRQIAGLPVPAIRIYAIESENRVYAIEAEDRTYSIASENRIYPIPG